MSEAGLLSRGTAFSKHHSPHTCSKRLTMFSLLRRNRENCGTCSMESRLANHQKRA
jgi:hypothetical protein